MQLQLPGSVEQEWAGRVAQAVLKHLSRTGEVLPMPTSRPSFTVRWTLARTLMQTTGSSGCQGMKTQTRG